MKFCILSTICVFFSILSFARHPKGAGKFKSKVIDSKTNKGVKCDIYIIHSKEEAFLCTTNDDGSFDCDDCARGERLKAYPTSETTNSYYESTKVSCGEAKKHGIKIKQTGYAFKKPRKSQITVGLPIVGIYWGSRFNDEDSRSSLEKEYENKIIIVDSMILALKGKTVVSTDLYNTYVADHYLNKKYSDSLNTIFNRNMIPAIAKFIETHFKGKDVELDTSKIVTFINLKNDVLFRPGEYTVLPQYTSSLKKISNFLKDYPEVEFMIEGNTDNTPYSNNNELIDNWDLSVKRATSVARILISFGINEKRITVAGKGEFNSLHPKSNQNDESVRAENRRTSIIILPNIHRTNFIQLH